MNKKLWLPTLFAAATAFTNKQRTQLPDRPRIKKASSMSKDERKEAIIRRKKRRAFKLARKDHHRRAKSL